MDMTHHASPVETCVDVCWCVPSSLPCHSSPVKSSQKLETNGSCAHVSSHLFKILFCFSLSIFTTLPHFLIHLTYRQMFSSFVTKKDPNSPHGSRSATPTPVPSISISTSMSTVSGATTATTSQGPRSASSGSGMHSSLGSQPTSASTATTRSSQSPSSLSSQSYTSPSSTEEGYAKKDLHYSKRLHWMPIEISQGRLRVHACPHMRTVSNGACVVSSCFASASILYDFWRFELDRLARLSDQLV